MTRIRVTIVIIVAVAVAAACGSDADDERVVVSAASSLIDRFEANNELLAETHPDLDVDLNFGGSTTLVTQVNEGAPVDLLAVADLEAARSVDVEIFEQTVIGESTLHLIRHRSVRPVTSLQSLADGEFVVAACDVALPCGRLTANVLDEADIDDEVIDTRESNVRAVLSRVERGEADYGFVYDTELPLLDEATEATLRFPSALTNERILLRLSDDAATREVFAEMVRLERARELARS